MMERPKGTIDAAQNCEYEFRVSARSGKYFNWWKLKSSVRSVCTERAATEQPHCV